MDMIAVDPGDFTAEAIDAIAPACGECGTRTHIATGREIYPHRPDLWEGRHYWRCSCGAYCGVHRGTLKPLGKPAGKETRTARLAAHAAFDPLWQKRERISGITRKQARGRGYKWLAAQLGIDRKACHIGEMDAATARRVVEICKGVGR